MKSWQAVLVIIAIVLLALVVAYSIGNQKPGINVRIEDFTLEATGTRNNTQEVWASNISILVKYKGNSTLNVLWIAAAPVNVTFADGSSKDLTHVRSPYNYTDKETLSKDSPLFFKFTIGGLQKSPKVVWVQLALKVEESEENVKFLAKVVFPT